MTTMAAMETILKAYELEAFFEDDLWTAYVNMPCPNPEMHSLTGVCHDCENKYYELKDGCTNFARIDKVSLC